MWACNSHTSWAIRLCSSENIYVRARFDGIPQSYIGAYARDVDKVLIMAFGLIWIGLIFFSYGEFKSSKDSKSSEDSQNVKAS